MHIPDITPKFSGLRKRKETIRTKNRRKLSACRLIWRTPEEYLQLPLFETCTGVNTFLTVVHAVYTSSFREPYAGACSDLKRRVTRVTAGLTPAPCHHDEPWIAVTPNTTAAARRSESWRNRRNGERALTSRPCRPAVNPCDSLGRPRWPGRCWISRRRRSRPHKHARRGLNSLVNAYTSHTEEGMG